MILQALLIAMTCLLFSGHAQSQTPKEPLKKRALDKILKEYTIVGDFSIKAEVRDNSDEIFWRHPLKFPRPEFEIKVLQLDDPQILEEFPKTPGQGKPIEHLNRGRVLFLEGKLELARQTWLSGRARYGKSYSYHRRTDYFIAYSFLYQALKKLKEQKNNFEHEEVRELFVNTSTFLSWAYGVKKSIPDETLDRFAPKAYYLLTAIYYKYERWSAAFGAVEDGLDFLQRTGRKEYRTSLRRIKAELYIKNRDYLSAVQQFDLALRQDKNIADASKIFARIGDIYFDLNNFELAEDMYSLAITVDRHMKEIRPWQLVLRGESLFWLGKFNESLRMMHYGLSSLGAPQVKEHLPYQFQALASIRIADSYLATKKYEKSRLSYSTHIKEFRYHSTLTAAKLREACLELPYYKGNNIVHARKVLLSLKEDTTLPIVAQELVWTCEIASYAQHERTPDLIDKVKKFYEKYPRSEFLKSLIEPVRKIQVQNINQYFEKNDPYGAVDFYLKNKKALFPTLDESYKPLLFEAFVDTSQSNQAKDFFDSYDPQTDEEMIKKAVMLSEVANDDIWEQRNRNFAKSLKDRKWSLKFSEDNHLYLNRILSSNGGYEHYRWIYKTVSNWVDQNFGVVCDLIYPVLQRIGDDRDHFTKEEFLSISKSFVSKYLEDMLKYETYCAYSVLEFEFNLFKNEPEYLSQQYLNRPYLPVNNVTASLYFAVAELNEKNKNYDSANTIWNKIVREGKENLPEVIYSRNRLDKRRTELEQLWR